MLVKLGLQSLSERGGVDVLRITFPVVDLNKNSKSPFISTCGSLNFEGVFVRLFRFGTRIIGAGESVDK